jgi:hypothetical protein
MGDRLAVRPSPLRLTFVAALRVPTTLRLKP